MQRLDKLYILTLSFIPKLGKITLRKILNNLKYKPSNLNELCTVIQPFKKLTPDQLEVAFNQAEQALQEHDNAGIAIIGIDDVEFPSRLRTIPNSPFILYVKGDISCLNSEHSVAVIGTRQPTDYGKKIGLRIAQRFAERKLTVVSGLAQGCDTVGHEGCLKGNGRTVAVMAHGLDRIYPSENKKLAQKIIDAGGCLVSEYPIGTKPFKNQFVERDRILSGLSSAVVIIETDVEGGTMHTARFCIEQGRILACVDYDVEHRSTKSRGNEKLIAEGKAISLKDSDDFKKLIANILSYDIHNVSNPKLSLEELAKRLQVNSSEITEKLDQDEDEENEDDKENGKSFWKWSQSKDPNEYPWIFLKKENLFVIKF